MKNIAIIPARGGSKRIPRKNIKDFMGKPVIAYSIEAAIKSNLFEEIMVSTDDEEIVEIAKKYGAKVPFLRSKKNSDDYATTADVINEVLGEYKNMGRQFDSFCCIYPTAPLVTSELIKDSHTMLINNDFDSVFPVAKFSYPIQRALKIDGKFVRMFWPEYYSKRSQDLEDAYHDSGQFYWMRIDRFLIEKKIFTNNSGAIELPALLVQDIDNESDWRIAELKYKINKL